MQVQYLNTTKDNEFTKNWNRVLIVENLDLSIRNSQLKFELEKHNIQFDKVKVLFGKDGPKGKALICICQEFLDQYTSPSLSISQILETKIIPVLHGLQLGTNSITVRIPNEEESKEHVTKRKNTSGKVRKIVNLNYVNYLYFIDFELAIAAENTYLPMEVGIVKVSRQDFSIVDQFHQLIHPGKIESQFYKTYQYAKNVHGLDIDYAEESGSHLFGTNYDQIWKQIVQFLNWNKERPLLIAKDPHVENMSLQWLQKKANEMTMQQCCTIALDRETVIDVPDFIMSFDTQISLEQSEVMLKTLHHFEGNVKEKCVLHQQLLPRYHCALQDCYTIVRWMRQLLLNEQLVERESEEQKLLKELKQLCQEHGQQEITNPVSWECTE